MTLKCDPLRLSEHVYEDGKSYCQCGKQSRWVERADPAPDWRARVRALIEQWRSRADGPIPTDRAIGISDCADELDALVRAEDKP